MKEAFCSRYKRTADRLRFLLALGFVLLPGCAHFGQTRPIWQQGKAVLIKDIRPPLAGTKTVTIRVSKAQYVKALQEGGDLNTARLVQVFSQEDTTNSAPQWRLFDVKKGSVYDVLGLLTADLVLAADGYVIPDSQLFWHYLNLISSYDRASIEILRGGRPIVLEYQFTA